MSGLQIEDLSVKGGAAYQGIWGYGDASHPHNHITKGATDVWRCIRV